MEGKDAAPMVPKHQHKRPKIEQPPTDSYALSPDSGISLDAFDGLLEISGVCLIWLLSIVETNFLLHLSRDTWTL